MTGVLTVILTVLKVVGIVLAVILGLLLVLILLILFAPIKYEVKGYKAGEDIDALAKVRWLTPLLRADVVYKKKPGEDAYFDYWVKVFWKKVYPTEDEEEEETEEPSAEKKTGKKKKEDAKPAIETEETTDYSKWDLKEEKDELSEYLDETGDREKTAIPDKSDKTSKSADSEKYTDHDTADDTDMGSDKKEKVPLKDKISQAIARIKEKLTAIKEKILSLRKDGEARYKWVKERKDFLTKDENIAAISKILNEVLKILIHCAPKKGGAVIDLGFEDASATGKAVGAYSFLYPHIGKVIVLNADFEKSVMDAKGNLEGRIVVFFILCRAAVLGLDKNVRRFIKEVQRYV